MDVRRCQEDMKARTAGIFQCLPRALDVRTASASQAGDDRTSNDRSNGLHRREITLRCDGKSSLNHVDAQAFELMRHAQLFRNIHASTGRLHPIPYSVYDYRYSNWLHTECTSGYV